MTDLRLRLRSVLTEARSQGFESARLDESVRGEGTRRRKEGVQEGGRRGDTKEERGFRLGPRLVLRLELRLVLGRGHGLRLGGLCWG